MSRQKGSINLMTKLRQNEPSEIQHLRTQLEAARRGADTLFITCENLRADLQLHKQALDVARVALNKIYECEHFDKFTHCCCPEDCRSALTTINNVLKDGK